MTACGWEVLRCDDCSAFENLDPAIQEQVDTWAVNRLWEWTNQRFGLCELTVHRDDPQCCGLISPYGPYYQCKRNELVLPGPIADVISVTIDGEDFALEGLHVDDLTVLVRDDGISFGTEWEVTYLQGEEVPPGGELVAGILACEYAKSICNDSSCRLPKRVSSIQRQGVVINNFSSGSTERGITGIFEIDDWVMTQNKPNRRASVYSPDISRPRIKTWSYADS